MGCTRKEIANKATLAVIKAAGDLSPVYQKLVYDAAMAAANSAVVVNPLVHNRESELLTRLEITVDTRTTSKQPKESVKGKELKVTPVNLVKLKDGKILNSVGKITTDTVRIGSIEQMADLAIQLNTLMNVVGDVATNTRWTNKFKELGIQTTFNPITVKLAHKVKPNTGLGLSIGSGHIQLLTDYSMYKPEVDGKPSPMRVLLHEYVHAITQMEMKTNPNNETVKKLVALYDRVKGREELKGEYGVHDVYEFVAEAISNTRFQEKLDKIGSKHTLVNKIKELFKTLLAWRGERGEVTALDEVLDLVTELRKQNLATSPSTKVKEGKISQYNNTANSLVEAAKGCAE